MIVYIWWHDCEKNEEKTSLSVTDIELINILETQPNDTISFIASDQS